MKSHHVIGLMSGTSLDGLDIASCTFSKAEQRWTYKIQAAETVPYTGRWKEVLSTLEHGTALDLVTADVEFGHLLGTMTRDFIHRNKLAPDFIASHGHTIFHQPVRRITCQIGRGSAITAETGLPVVCDFRSTDVAMGGQGAPLVPIGDELLFGDFDYCLNIGGFANISYRVKGQRIAYDICAANIVLNDLAGQCGLDFDPDGRMAARGAVSESLLQTLNSLPFFSQSFPKSLGKEWVVEHIRPLIERTGLTVNDLLATFCEHIAIQVAAAGGPEKGTRMLVTGGGAFNKFLIGRIRHYATATIVIPDPLTVNYKEALIFAFLGVLRWRREINCLRSVTGASEDCSGGAVY